MNIVNKTKKSIFIFSIVAFLAAGTGKSVGTSGAGELLIPTGAKGVALNTSYGAVASGVDAI